MKVDRRKPAKYIILALLVAVAVGALFRHQKIDSAYSEAEQLVFAGAYQEAVEQLEAISHLHYRDTEALLRYCEAHLEYEDGDISSAYVTLRKAIVFQYQPAELNQELAEFRALVEKEYIAAIEAQRKKEKEQQEERIRNGVPYVGMPEERIADTSLGKPSEKVRHNYEMKGGKSYLANLYDFYQNGKFVFTARCVDGVVTEVWDSRDHPQEPLTADPEPPTYAGPSVEGFSNPEDFYDWYMDDFYDYYDAEDYYYDHGGR